MEPLVSIIIPVYNVNRELLSSCLESVLGQTYKNIEVVIVNDGSTDDTFEYCSRIAGKKHHVQVIDQENGGVSIARNNGTLAAQGEYVFFVDGDDLLTEDAIEEAVSYAVEHDTDLVIGAVSKIMSHNEFHTDKNKHSGKYELLDSESTDRLRRHYLGLNDDRYRNISNSGYVNRGPYCRLIKRSIAVRNLFPNSIPIGEDLIWNMSLLSHCKRVCVVYSVWYGYLLTGGSAIRKYYGNRAEKVEEYLNRLWEENASFCTRNLDVFGKNMAVELYCILRYELMSAKCRLSDKEKKAFVKKMLSTKPWNLLKNPKAKTMLPFKHKILLCLCETGSWIQAMRIMYTRSA